MRDLMLLAIILVVLLVVRLEVRNLEDRIVVLENDKCSTVEILVERSYDRNTGTYHYEVVGEGR